MNQLIKNKNQKQILAKMKRATKACLPLLLIDGHPCVAALHDLRHGGEVQHGGAGQHEAVLQRRQDVLHRLGAQHSTAELLLHKLAAQSGQRRGSAAGVGGLPKHPPPTPHLTCKGRLRWCGSSPWPSP